MGEKSQDLPRWRHRLGLQLLCEELVDPVQLLVLYIRQ